MNMTDKEFHKQMKIDKLVKIEHIDNNEFYLVCEDGKLLFDFYAYDIVVDKVKEHNKNLARENQSSLKK